MLSKEYIAGFFDGEGCIRLGKYRHGKYITYSPQCHITNKYIDTLIKIKEQYAGNLRPNSANPSCFQLTISGYKNIKRFLSDICPFLRQKKKEANMTLEYINKFGEVERHKKGIQNTIADSEDTKLEKDRYYNLLRQLKKVEVL